MTALATAEIRPSHSLEVTPGASLARLCGPARLREGERPGGGLRGKVEAFSWGASKRLKEVLSRIPRSEPCLMVTLTIPASHAPGPDDSRAILKRWRERFKYHFPAGGYVHKREFTRKGTVHFHLLCWHVQRRELRRWADSAWSESLDIQDEVTRAKGLRAGVQVTPVLDVGGLRYLGKYASKPAAAPDGAQGWGHWWGTCRPETMPQAESVSIPLEPRAFARVMRVMRKAALVEVNTQRGFLGKPPMKRLKAATWATGWTRYLCDPDVWLRVAAHASFG